MIQLAGKNLIWGIPTGLLKLLGIDVHLVQGVTLTFKCREFARVKVDLIPTAGDDIKAMFESKDILFIEKSTHATTPNHPVHDRL